MRTRFVICFQIFSALMRLSGQTWQYLQRVTLVIAKCRALNGHIWRHPWLSGVLKQPVWADMEMVSGCLWRCACRVPIHSRKSLSVMGALPCCHGKFPERSVFLAKCCVVYALIENRKSLSSACVAKHADTCLPAALFWTKEACFGISTWRQAKENNLCASFGANGASLGIIWALDHLKTWLVWVWYFGGASLQVSACIRGLSQHVPHVSKSEVVGKAAFICGHVGWLWRITMTCFHSWWHPAQVTLLPMVWPTNREGEVVAGNDARKRTMSTLWSLPASLEPCRHFWGHWYGSWGIERLLTSFISGDRKLEHKHPSPKAWI